MGYLLSVGMKRTFFVDLVNQYVGLAIAMMVVSRLGKKMDVGGVMSLSI